ncbi:MAG TPA: HEAT repeat domain-containing protein, partial [Mucilaginibacter sp.]
AKARLLALYVLEGSNSLTPQIVKQALKDPAPGVRENALMLAERYPECLPQVIEKADDPSAGVVLQASLSLGEFSGKGVATALAKIIGKYGGDKFIRSAVLSSNIGSSAELLKELSQGSFFQKEEPWKISFLTDLSYVIGARNKKEQVGSYLSLLSGSVTGDNWQSAAVSGLKAGLSKAAKPGDQLTEIVKNIKTNSAGDTKEAISNLKKLY